MIDKSNYTGIILAGGKSSRMGKEKGFLELKGKTYTEILIKTLQSVFKEVIIIANDEQYEQFGIPVYKDIVTNSGPLAGIYTGLKNSNTDYNFFIPCDTPFLDDRLITKLIQESENELAIIPTFENRIYPLTAIYHKDCIANFEKALNENRLKVKLEIERVNHKFVEFEESYKENFINFNTPEDIKEYESTN